MLPEAGGDLTDHTLLSPLTKESCVWTRLRILDSNPNLTQPQPQPQPQHPNTPTPTLSLTLPSPPDPHQAGGDFSALSAAADAGVLSDAPPPNTLTEDDLQKEIAKAVQNVEGVSDADKEKVTLAPTLTQPQP